MKQRSLNVFILNDNAEEAGKLRRYLLKRFGDLLNISLFFNRHSFFRMMDNHVDLVVVDDYHSSKDTHPEMQVLTKVKAEHPSAEVVILSSHENVGTAVEALRKGAREYILNKKGAWHAILRVIDQSITQPVRYLIAEYGIKVFVTAFVSVWALLGIITYLALKFWV